MSSSSASRAGRGALWRMLLALQKQRRTAENRLGGAPPLSLLASAGSGSSLQAAAGGLPSQIGALHTLRSSTPFAAAATTEAKAGGTAGGGTRAATAATTAASVATRPSTSSSSLLYTSAPSSASSPSPNPSLVGRGRFYDTVRISPVDDPDALQRQAGKAPPPRFPGTPSSSSSSSWWQLTLRGYPAKTPGHNSLLLPTRALALAVAAEWEWLPDGKPVSVAMPLTALVATALDQPKPRAAVEQTLLKFVHTDAAAVRYDPGTALERKQREAFDDLLAWAADPKGPIRAPDGPLVPSSAVSGAPQTPGTEAAFARYLRSLDAWTLAAVDQATAASKSLVVAAALAHGRVGVEEALRAARLEEDHQTGEWGVVEAGHDLDACDAAARVASAAVLLRLLRME